MITVASLLIAVPGAYGLGIHVPDMNSEPSQINQPFVLNCKSMVLAENEHKAADSQSQASDEYQSQAAEPEAAVEETTDKQTNGTATKPLKPFRPSEEIAADQAVDFPVDI